MNPIRPILIFAIMSTTALADERSQTLSGARLVIETPCAKLVTIQPAPTLSGKVEVSATADHPEELSHLALLDGASATVRSTGEECWRPPFTEAFDPTLSIAIRVPAGSPIAIDEDGGADYQIGAVAGPLTVKSGGTIRLAATSITALDADLAGSGHLVITKAEGQARVSLEGSGTVEIGTAALHAVNLDLSGSGTVQVKSGSVGRLELDISGSGSVDMPDVGSAAIQIDGSGQVKIAKIAGDLKKEINGSGEVQIGRP